jgi:hypothetical protein
MTMKLTIALLLAGFLTAPAWAADAPDEVKAAAQKLADQANYSWSAKVETPRRERTGGDGPGARPEGRGEGRSGGGGRRGVGGFGGGGFGAPPSGKTEKNGFTVLTFTGRSNTTEVVVKGTKVALKSGDEWSTAEELADASDGGDAGGFNPARFTARRAEQTKLPPAEATELLGRAKNVKKDGEAYSGELTPEGLKEMFTFRGRGRGQGGQGGNNAGGERRAPDVSGLKGTAKFWVKDGILAKYESHVEGKMPGFPGRDGAPAREMDVTRTTTVEIKDIGSTKVLVPAEAKKKLKS